MSASLPPASPVPNSTTVRYKSFCENNDVPRGNTSSASIDLGRIPDRRRLNNAVSNLDAMTSEAPADAGHERALEQVPSAKLQCCCGRPGCAYLEHNNAALAGIERDLERAAVMGQALLSRHESYVAETQLETDRLNANIAELESERKTLQAANEKIVAENRDLLSKLDGLNKSYSESDNTVKSLEDLLKDTEAEVQRLSGFARRAEELELRVQEMDCERADMMRKLRDGEQESRSTLARWRESERKLRQLEIEVEKIEWDAKMEREKHEELVSRLERERVLERELGGAEGRLKGAAALQGIESGTGGNVVSSFVRDILQDNANLQSGIVELRELLQSSNDEVQNLRQHVMHHQPVETESDTQISRSLPLDQQVQWQGSSLQPAQREVHVHHHYHAKLAPRGNRTPTIRRASKRKAVMQSGVYLSTPESSVPSTPLQRPQRFISSPVVPVRLSQPQPKHKRWSNQTVASTISSLPSSPRSYFDRNSSIFDRLDAAEESSRPTSPDSTGFSPRLGSTGAQALNTVKLDSIEVVLEDDDEVLPSPDTDFPKDGGLGTSKQQQSSRPSMARDLTPKPSQMLTPSKPIDIHPKSQTPRSNTAFPDAPPLSPMSPMSEPSLPPETQTRSEEVVENSDPPTPAGDEDDFDNYTEDEQYESPEDQATVVYQEHRYDDEPHANIHDIEIRPSLRRSSSHDSLVSISGMDIHIAKRPPTSHSHISYNSQASSSRLSGNRAHFAISPSATRTISASQPAIGVTSTPAVLSNRSFSGGSVSQGPAGRSLELAIGGSPSSLRQSQQQSTSTFGLGLVGGWMRSKWGVAPTKTRSVADLRSAATPARPKAVPIQSPRTRSGEVPISGSLSGSLGGRIPGINQKGAIPGIWLQQKAESRVVPEVIDEEGLRDGLAEGGD